MKTILTSKTILLLAGIVTVVTLLATAGCVVDDRDHYHHDHDHAVIVAPAPVVVRPPVVIVH